MTKYFEDFEIGEEIELGSVTITAEEIVEFAERYDPQPFHVDPSAAAASMYGGLIASGWHTGSLYMRLLCDGLLNDTSGQGSPGLEELRWLAPVRPGDTLRARYVVLDARPSSSTPNRGTVTFRGEMLNQDDVLVVRMAGRQLYGTRPT